MLAVGLQLEKDSVKSRDLYEINWGRVRKHEMGTFCHCSVSLYGHFLDKGKCFQNNLLGESYVTGIITVPNVKKKNFFSRQKEVQSMVANYNDLKARCETAEHQVKVN